MPLIFTPEQSEKIRKMRAEQRDQRMNKPPRKSSAPSWMIVSPVFGLGFMIGIVYMGILGAR